MKDKEIKHLVIIISVLLAILIVPFHFSRFKGVWDYHVNYVTENEIANYVKDYLNADTAFCLGQSTLDDQIVTWWQTDEPFGKFRVLCFKKIKYKYYLDRDRCRSNESFGFSQSFPDCHAILITAEHCVKFSYILDETLYTVPVDAVPFAYCFPGIPADLVPYIEG